MHLNSFLHKQMFLYSCVYHLTATFVYFSKPAYVLNKFSRRYIHILLSKPLSFDIEINFIDEEGTATSKLTIISSQHLVITVILQEERTTSL